MADVRPPRRLIAAALSAMTLAFMTGALADEPTGGGRARPGDAAPALDLTNDEVRDPWPHLAPSRPVQVIELCDPWPGAAPTGNIEPSDIVAPWPGAGVFPAINDCGEADVVAPWARRAVGGHEAGARRRPSAGAGSDLVDPWAGAPSPAAPAPMIRGATRGGSDIIDPWRR